MNNFTVNPTSNGYTTDSSPASPTSSDNNKCIIVPDSRTSASDVTSSANDISEKTSTPKKLQVLTGKPLYSPSGCDIRSSHIFSETRSQKLLKDRYLLITEKPPVLTGSKSVFKNFVDLSSSNLKCVDIYTGEQFLCKIINEPLSKVQMAYYKLQQDNCTSDILEHELIRSVKAMIRMSKNRTYLLVSQGPEIYEDLHTYIRNKRRLEEDEAKWLFHQICQTVHICHRNGIILRDLKLKRFFFVDAERTKLQYESLEGSMILDNPEDDTLYDKIGCPLYTAPELLCPNTTYAGKAADIWSLGVILFTMLIGQYPFYEKGGCNLITIIRHCQVQIPTVLTKPVRFLLRNLLRRVPEERLRAEHINRHPWLANLKPSYLDITIHDIEAHRKTEKFNKKREFQNDDESLQPQFKRVKNDDNDTEFKNAFSMDFDGEMG